MIQFYLILFFSLPSILFSSLLLQPADCLASAASQTDPSIHFDHHPPPSPASAPLTLVTAAFNISSKHSQAEYLSWAAAWMLQRLPVVCFISPELLPLYRPLRAAACPECPTIWVASYASPSLLPLFADVSAADWAQQRQRDPQQARAFPELYAVWLGKLDMLQWAVLRNPFGTSYFAWMDIGVFRMDLLGNGNGEDAIANHTQRVRAFQHLDRAKLANHAMKRHVVTEYHTIRGDRFPLLDAAFAGPKRSGRVLLALVRPGAPQGGFIVGMAEGLLWLREEIAALIRVLSQRGVFWGDDQLLLGNLLRQSPSRFMLYTRDPILYYRCPIDPWFFFPYFLSGTMVLQCDLKLYDISRVQLA